MESGSADRTPPRKVGRPRIDRGGNPRKMRTARATDYEWQKMKECLEYVREQEILNKSIDDFLNEGGQRLFFEEHVKKNLPCIRANWFGGEYRSTQAQVLWATFRVALTVGIRLGLGLAVPDVFKPVILDPARAELLSAVPNESLER